MKERPIIFSAPMVRAIMDGRKTQTRRVVKDQRLDAVADVLRRAIPRRLGGYECMFADPNHEISLKPYCAPGDLLWVRECFSYRDFGSFSEPDVDKDPGGEIWYWADGNVPTHGNWTRPKPSTNMPRWASRLTLRVTDVRVQRVQEISEEDARAEGLVWWTDPPHAPDVHYGIARADVWETDPRKTFARLWDSINSKRAPWSSNPWVWAITFERVDEKP